MLHILKLIRRATPSDQRLPTAASEIPLRPAIGQIEVSAGGAEPQMEMSEARHLQARDRRLAARTTPLLYLAAAS